jgi:hypothetical protein
MVFGTVKKLGIPRYRGPERFAIALDHPSPASNVAITKTRADTRAVPRLRERSRRAALLGRDAIQAGTVVAELHPDKTRPLEFGRSAAVNRQSRDVGRPETFTFLGFIFICGRSRRGAFQLKRKMSGSHAAETQAGQGGATEAHARTDSSARAMGSSGRWFADTSHITRCLSTRGHSSHSGITSPIYGGARSGGAVRSTP